MSFNIEIGGISRSDGVEPAASATYARTDKIGKKARLRMQYRRPNFLVSSLSGAVSLLK